MLRKDIVLLFVLAFSVLFMSVSKPDNIDAKVLVWDYAFILVVVGTVFWVLSEVLDWVVGMTVSPTRDIPVERMTRNGLIAVAERQGLGSKTELNKMSDDEIAALILAGNGGGTIEATRPMSAWGFFIYVVKFWLRFVAKILSMIKTTASLVTMKKAKRKKILSDLIRKLKKEIYDAK
jgi:hypothetical protein